jgi:hypothetical protein
MKQLKRFFAFTLVLMTMTACTFAYIPPVPEVQEWEPTLDLRGSRGLALENGELVLYVMLTEVPAPDWLAVQWFGPGRRSASESVWIDPERVGEELRIALPEDVPLVPGLWRVVLSYQAIVARQFSLAVE